MKTATSTPGRTKSRDLLIVLSLKQGYSASFPIEEQNNIRAKIARYKGQADESGVMRDYSTCIDRKRHCITVTRL